LIRIDSTARSHSRVEDFRDEEGHYMSQRDRADGRAFHGACTRRSALGGLVALAASGSFAGAAHAQSRTLRIGASFDASGVEKANGNGLHSGSMACFEAINRAGGIHGVKLELVVADDRFNPDTAKANALKFAGDSTCLALLHPLGTRQTAAIMDAVPDMAVVGPNTGTVALRKKAAPNTFWCRANYAQEVDKLVATAFAQGLTKIGIVHPDDPLGQSVLAAFKASMARQQSEPAVVATTPNTTSMEVEPAARTIAQAQPQVVIMSLAGTAPAFVRALRKAGCTSTTYGLSITASAAGITDLGELARGLGFSVVVPSPFATKYGIVRQYQADMLANGTKDYSLPSLEGYIDARVLVEGLRRAGPKVTRESLIAALERIDALDLGGFRIQFGKGNREGSRFVDVAVIGSQGRMLS